MLTKKHPLRFVIELNLNAMFWNRKTVGNNHTIRFLEVNINFNKTEWYSPVLLTLFRSLWQTCSNVFHVLPVSESSEWSLCCCASVTWVYFSSVMLIEFWNQAGAQTGHDTRTSGPLTSWLSARPWLCPPLREYRFMVALLNFWCFLWIYSEDKLSSALLLCQCTQYGVWPTVIVLL